MGGALLRGWLSCPALSSLSLTVLQRSPSDALKALCETHDIALTSDAQRVVDHDILVLAVKPQQFSEVGPLLQPYVGPETTMLSVMTGKTLDHLRDMFPQAQACIRTMPNILATVGKSITPAVIDDVTQGVSRAYAHVLLEAVGTVEWVDSETLFDGMTAVSGSGPAYVFYLVDCLAQAGKNQGIPADLAMRLARATVAGSGIFLDSSLLSPEEMRESVTSPGGTTAEALAHLMNPQKGLQPLLDEAVSAACKRSRTLTHA
jgi:pyrroline-5-carboxylate reductase